MQLDPSRIDDAVIALLASFSFDDRRSWKGFDFEVMNRLHAQGLIDDPRGKAKSVYLTDAGFERGMAIARTLFGARSQVGI